MAKLLQVGLGLRAQPGSPPPGLRAAAHTCPSLDQSPRVEAKCQAEMPPGGPGPSPQLCPPGWAVCPFRPTASVGAAQTGLVIPKAPWASTAPPSENQTQVGPEAQSPR